VETGTARAARSLKRPLVGKTGTTNQSKDAWFVGYSTELIAGVWVGYDDALPLGKGESGSVTALPAWMAFMRAAHERRPATDFPRPSSIVVIPVDRRSGLLPYVGDDDTMDEEFLDGTVPTEAAVPEAGAAEADAGSVVPNPPASSGSAPAQPDAEAPF
jgi:penicillin-binding protein 1A